MFGPSLDMFGSLTPPTGRFPWGGGGYKRPPCSLAQLATQFKLQTLWDTLLSSKLLSLKLHLNLRFLGEILASISSYPLNLQLKHFINDLHVFVTLWDLSPR
jgi:hypothetical protein